MTGVQNRQRSEGASMTTRWTKEGGHKHRTEKDKYVGRLHREINTMHEYSCTQNTVCVHVTYTVVTVHAICEGLDFNLNKFLNLVFTNFSKT